MTSELIGASRRSLTMITALAILGLAGRTLHAQSADKPAQARGVATGKLTQVVVALSSNHGKSHVRAAANPKTPAVIVVDSAELTPESLAHLLLAYNTARSVRHEKKDDGRTAMVRSRNGSTAALSARQRAHYQTMVDRLLSAPEQAVPGLGKVKAIRVNVVSGAGKAG